MNQIIKNQSTFQENTNAINQVASEVVNAFGKDTHIGQSYTKLAESAEKASQALERLAHYLEARQRQRQA